MTYITIPPTPLLENYVRFFWILESDELTQPYIHRSMADSCTEMLFHYRGRFDEITSDGSLTSSFLSGIHSQTHNYRRFRTREQFGIFGAYLYPYAVNQLFGLSPDELTNLMPDLHTALGNQGKILEEQIMLATDHTERYRILNGFLEKQLHNHSPDNHPAIQAVKYLISSKNVHRVSELAQEFNLSERQFVRKFRQYSGLTPKLCMRIIRFGEACNQYGQTGKKTLTEIAHECGYYDQSHFISEFREFSGYEPHTYFSGDPEGVEWRDGM